jgi:hypothetical protein
MLSENLAINHFLKVSARMRRRGGIIIYVEWYIFLRRKCSVCKVIFKWSIEKYRGDDRALRFTVLCFCSRDGAWYNKQDDAIEMKFGARGRRGHGKGSP